ncbi:hypothetical protein YPPY01_2347, partial [Yersinia pestis PY-01]
MLILFGQQITYFGRQICRGSKRTRPDELTSVSDSGE